MIPAAGVTPGTPLRFSRAYAVTGVAHAIDAEHIATREPVATLCGRQISPLTVWSAEDWPRMVATAQRLPHWDTGTCRRCVKLATA